MNDLGLFIPLYGICIETVKLLPGESQFESFFHCICIQSLEY